MKLKLNVIALIAANLLPIGVFAHDPTAIEKYDLEVAHAALQNFEVDLTSISDEELTQPSKQIDQMKILLIVPMLNENIKFT